MSTVSHIPFMTTLFNFKILVYRGLQIVTDRNYSNVLALQNYVRLAVYMCIVREVIDYLKEEQLEQIKGRTTGVKQ